MYGNNMGVEVSVISVEKNFIKNFESLIKICDLDVKEFIFSPYALGHSVLSDEEKQLGAAIIDIGAELTTITIFLHGEIVFTKIISMGGNLVTKDISRIFSLSLYLPLTRRSPHLDPQFDFATLVLMLRISLLFFFFFDLG